jgi:membrane protease YdiL (CAAX protease family)
VFALAEALLVFAVIMAYIWELRVANPYFRLVPAALIVASHLARHERPEDLGFRAGNFGDCVRRLGPAVLGLVLAIWGTGMLLASIRPLGFGQAVPSLVAYLPWGLAQQYLLNGYFLRRFEMALSRTGAGILTAGLFCVVHSPNWFLMLVTLAAAIAAIWVYRNYRNLYFLGLAHAMIGFSLFMVVPDSVSHHLRVGPGWFTWR